MASFHSDRLNRTVAASGDAIPVSAATDEVLGPIIAGAYARGVAETLDLLGVPGLFLDPAGEVLFASRAASPLLRGPLRLHMRHLVAEAAMDNQSLGSFIADAVGSAALPAALRLPGSRLELLRLPRTPGTTLAGQRLRAVLVVADLANPRHAAALQLIGELPPNL